MATAASPPQQSPPDPTSYTVHISTSDGHVTRSVTLSASDEVVHTVEDSVQPNGHVYRYHDQIQSERVRAMINAHAEAIFDLVYERGLGWLNVDLIEARGWE